MICASNIKPNLMAKHHQTQNGTIIHVQNFRYRPQQYISDDTKITGTTNKMLQYKITNHFPIPSNKCWMHASTSSGVCLMNKSCGASGDDLSLAIKPLYAGSTESAIAALTSARS